MLNQIQIGLIFHSTLIQHFLCSRKWWMALKPFEHSAQYVQYVQQLPSIRSTFVERNVGQMLKPFKRALRQTINRTGPPSGVFTLSDSLTNQACILNKCMTFSEKIRSYPNLLYRTISTKFGNYRSKTSFYVNVTNTVGSVNYCLTLDIISRLVWKGQ